MNPADIQEADPVSLDCLRAKRKVGGWFDMAAAKVATWEPLPMPPGYGLHMPLRRPTKAAQKRSERRKAAASYV